MKAQVIFNDFIKRNTYVFCIPFYAIWFLVLKILPLFVFNWVKFIFFKRMDCFLFFVKNLPRTWSCSFHQSVLFICERRKWMQVVKETTERREKEVKWREEQLVSQPGPSFFSSRDSPGGRFSDKQQEAPPPDWLTSLSAWPVKFIHCCTTDQPPPFSPSLFLSSSSAAAAWQACRGKAD